MNPNSPQDSEPGVLAAIEQVLSAERGSEAALDKTRVAATATVAAAAERAAAIAARARARIATLHERCAQALPAAIQQIEQPELSAPGEVHCGDELTQRLAERVARNLLGDKHDAVGG